MTFSPRLLTFFSVNLCIRLCWIIAIYSTSMITYKKKLKSHRDAISNFRNSIRPTVFSVAPTRATHRRIQVNWINHLWWNKKYMQSFYTQPIPKPNNTLNICSIKIQADSTLKNLLVFITLNSLSVCRGSVVWRNSCCISEYVSHYLAIIRCLPIVSLCEISAR